VTDTGSRDMRPDLWVSQGAQVPSSRQSKRPHQLHECQDLGQLLGALARHGVDPNQIARDLVKTDVQYGLLAVGSIPEGMGTATSDVDFLVLIDHAAGLAQRRSGISMNHGISREVLLYHNGLEINIDLVSRDMLLPVMESLMTVASIMYEPDRVSMLPILDSVTVRLLHRLRTGWPLTGGTMITQWRDEYMVEILPMYLAAKYYVYSLEWLERACSQTAGPPGAVAYLSRLAVESALLSLLATEGYTSPTTKALLSWCARAEATTGGIARLVEQCRGLMFPDVLTSHSERHAYIEAVTSAIRAVRDHINRDVAVARSTDHLCKQIKYVGLETLMTGQQ
jgi:hypothetical protein